MVVSVWHAWIESLLGIVSKIYTEGRSTQVQTARWRAHKLSIIWTNDDPVHWHIYAQPVTSFTKEVNWRLAKCPLKTNGRLANRQLASLVKEATGLNQSLKRS